MPHLLRGRRWTASQSCILISSHCAAEEWSSKKGRSLYFITCPGIRYIWFCYRLGFGCQRWMNIIIWVCGQPSWQGNLIPFFRFAESSHQVLRWENCHCLPKTPLVLFPVIGSCSAIHILLFKVGQSQGCRSLTFSLVVSLSFPSCSDKDADPEANIWLRYRCPTSTNIALGTCGTGAVSSKSYHRPPAAVTCTGPSLPTSDALT